MKLIIQTRLFILRFVYLILKSRDIISIYVLTKQHIFMAKYSEDSINSIQLKKKKKKSLYLNY